MRGFESYHPFALAIYFISVFIIVMFSSNPVIVLLALIGAVFYGFFLESKEVMLRKLLCYIPLFLTIALINPLLSHNGLTVLFYFNDNQVTLEALLYGINMALMIIGVFAWFTCFNIVFTSDKLLFVFGKLSPRLALTISAALRYIPLLKRQSEAIRKNTKALGLYASDSIYDRLRSSLRVYSALIGWSLENAMDKGMSMKARGYGIQRRSQFALYKFRIRDMKMLFAVVLVDIIFATAQIMGKLSCSFYPKIVYAKCDVYGMLAHIAFAFLAFMPALIEVKEGVAWKYYRSKI